MICASCGEANPARARFCSTCGSPLAAGWRRGVRKVVTVVVCDITGSTALGERLDPESLGLVARDRARDLLEGSGEPHDCGGRSPSQPPRPGGPVDRARRADG